MQGLTIYKSSAGSGKTFTLVKEYLKLVLKNPLEQPNILAITFTNKATGEMKHRIINSLAELANNSNQMLKELLQKELPGINIQNASRLVIEKILHNYSGFAVSTIDSFFHKIIKSFARELHLPLKFEIELDTEFVTDKVIESLLQELNTKHDLSGWLRSFMMEKLSEDKGWKIEREIAEIAKELFREKGIDPNKIPSRENIALFREKMIIYRSQFEIKIKELSQKALEVIDNNGLTFNDFSYKLSGPGGYFKKVYNNPGDCEMNRYVLKAIDDANAWAPRSSPFFSLIIDVADSYLIPILLEIRKTIDKHYHKYNTAKEALRYLYLCGILNDINEQLKKYRDENDIVLISDMPALLRAGINESDTPFIYEKTGIAFKHFLIDEFQDTSDFQWNNILPLIRNSLAGNNFTLIVGDVKQSIYRWRGGNMELLMKNIKTHLSEFKSMTKEIALATNYRSKKNIVEFNNDFFSTSLNLLKSHIEYGDENLIDIAYKKEELNQLVSDKNNNGGYSEIKFFGNDQIKNFETKGEENLKWKDLSLNYLLVTINKSLEDGFQLKDMAILVRRNTEGNEIANFLFQNGIEKVVSPDSLLIKSSPRIRILLSILRYIANNKNYVARSHILYYLSKNNFVENNLPLHDFFTNSGISKERTTEFLKEIKSLEILPLYETAENLVRKLRFDKSPDAYLQRFLDLILDFSIKNGSDVNAFLLWFDENNQQEKTSLVVPEDENAVTIMTIHKAKGLQFPVVIIPFAEWDMVPHKNALMWIENYDAAMPVLAVKASQNLKETDFKNDYLKECALTYLDNLNLLYVAFTRPEVRLHIFSCMPKNSGSITKTSQLIFNYVSSKAEFDNTTLTYTTGSKSANAVNLLSTEETTMLTTFVSNPWSNKLKIKLKKKRKTENSESLNKTLLGTAIHQAFSELNNASDLPKVINKLKEQGICPENEVNELNSSINYFLQNPFIADWYNGDWQIISEQELLLPDGEILRPDRVMVKNNKAIIVDYKTGTKEVNHHKQLNQYGKSLLDAGYFEVKKYLLYLQHKELVEVI